VVKVFPNAQYSALTMHVLCECLANGSLRKGMLEDFARNLAHTAELTFAISGCGHGKDYKDLLPAFSRQGSGKSQTPELPERNFRGTLCRRSGWGEGQLKADS